MITALTQDRIREAARVAVREQAWIGTNGVLGVRVRRDQEKYVSGATVDVTAVYELLAQAVALRWTRYELTLWLAGDVAHHVAVTMPGLRDQDDAEDEDLVVGTARLDDVLHRTSEPPAPVPARVAGSVAWEVEGPDGLPVYLGCDVELAWELYHLLPANGSHLFPAPPAARGAGDR